MKLPSSERFIQPFVMTRLKMEPQKLIGVLILRALFITGILFTLSSCSHTYQFPYTPAVPIPLTISITTPALTVFSEIIQKGRGEMEVMIYSAKEGQKETIPSLKGASYYKKYVIFFVPFTKTDIPEP